MDWTRAPSVAGMFYPEQEPKLRAEVEAMLAEAEAALDPAVGGPVPAVAGGPGGISLPKAIIAPHAGYIYSGPVAASAYIRLKAHAHAIYRVVLLAGRLEDGGLAREVVIRSWPIEHRHPVDARGLVNQEVGAANRKGVDLEVGNNRVTRYGERWEGQ